MGAPMIKVLIISLMFSSSIFATEIDPQKIIKIAKSYYDIAKVNYETSLKACEESEKVLNPSIFSKINISKSDLESALISIYTRTNAECSKQERALYLFESTRYLDTANYFNIKLTEPDLRSADTVLTDSYKMFLVEDIFNNLDPKARQQLESISELRRPFNAFKTIEGLKK